MSVKKALTESGKRDPIRGHSTVSGDVVTERPQQRFPLDDVTQRRMARPGQYGVVQLRLRGKAQANDRNPAFPCGGKRGSQRVDRRLHIPRAIPSGLPQCRERRSLHHETRIKSKAGGGKVERVPHVVEKSLRCGTRHAGQKLDAQFQPAFLNPAATFPARLSRIAALREPQRLGMERLHAEFDGVQSHAFQDFQPLRSHGIGSCGTSDAAEYTFRLGLRRQSHALRLEPFRKGREGSAVEGQFHRTGRSSRCGGFGVLSLQIGQKIGKGFRVW